MAEVARQGEDLSVVADGLLVGAGAVGDVAQRVQGARLPLGVGVVAVEAQSGQAPVSGVVAETNAVVATLAVRAARRAFGTAPESWPETAPGSTSESTPESPHDTPPVVPGIVLDPEPESNATR